MAHYLWKKFHSIAAALCLICALPGCTEDPRAREIRIVRTDFAKLWEDRAEKYRLVINNFAQRPSQSKTNEPWAGEGTPGKLIRKHIYIGALRVLESFKVYRRSEPVLSVTLGWLDDQKRFYTNEISKLETSHEALKPYIGIKFNFSLQSSTPAKIARLAMNLGALAELTQLQYDLNKFRDEYVDAYRRGLKDYKKPQPLQPPSKFEAEILESILGILGLRKSPQKEQSP